MVKLLEEDKSPDYKGKVRFYRKKTTNETYGGTSTRTTETVMQQFDGTTWIDVEVDYEEEW